MSSNNTDSNIKEVSLTPEEMVKKYIPEDALVLDVGGCYAPYARANWIIDYLPFSSVNMSQIKGGGKVRFSEKTYISHDICSREPWPFKDKQFDFCICSHVLEDIRDPIWVCSEILRVSKAGYIEVPSRFWESTHNSEFRGLAGNSHHRWVIDLFEGKLRFTLKRGEIHMKAINKNRKKKVDNIPENYLRLIWNGPFDAYEHHIDNTEDILEYFMGRKVGKKEIWKIYRKIEPHNFIIRWAKYFKRITFNS